MTTELLYGALPAIVAAAAAVGSWLVSRRAHSAAHWGASGFVFAATAWSLRMLHRIFFLNAWPTYLPHIVIGLTVAVVLVQVVSLRRGRA